MKITIRETPRTIPNLTVKPYRADGSTLCRVRVGIAPFLFFTVIIMTYLYFSPLKKYRIYLTDAVFFFTYFNE